jgi:C-terminal processing protease CtpA/Prc
MRIVEAAFSGAACLAITLKDLRRAVIVGETTGGGAHLTRQFRVTEHFAVWVPFGRGVSPITHTNWEGVGLAPDVAVPAADALRTAIVLL